MPLRGVRDLVFKRLGHTLEDILEGGVQVVEVIAEQDGSVLRLETSRLVCGNRLKKPGDGLLIRLDAGFKNPKRVVHTRWFRGSARLRRIAGSRPAHASQRSNPARRVRVRARWRSTPLRWRTRSPRPHPRRIQTRRGAQHCQKDTRATVADGKTG